MSPQATDLIAQRCRCDRVLLRPPLRPFLPGAAAHPTRHHEDAKTVRLMPEAIVLVIAFQTQRVEMHVERITDLRILSLGLRAEEHIGRPASAANENASAVHSEETPSLWRRFRGDLSNAKA